MNTFHLKRDNYIYCFSRHGTNFRIYSTIPLLLLEVMKYDVVHELGLTHLSMIEKSRIKNTFLLNWMSPHKKQIQTHNQVNHSIHRINFIHSPKMIRPVIPLLLLHETIRHYTIVKIPLNNFLSFLCSFMKSHSPHYAIQRNSLQFQNNISYQWQCRLHWIAYSI